MTELDWLNWLTDKPLVVVVLLYFLWRIEHKWMPIFEELHEVMIQVKEHLLKHNGH